MTWATVNKKRLESIPSMDWKVPGFPEGEDVVGIPPIAVELAVGELHDLADRVEEGVEEQVEPRQPDQVVGDLFRIAEACGFAVWEINF